MNVHVASHTNEQSTNAASGRIASLDGLRAIAVALVISGHSADAYLGGDRDWWVSPFTNSSLGVRLFFVLSGFLITGLLMREQRSYGRISFRDFYLRRSIRIFPAFYTYLLVTMILVTAGWVDISRQQFFAAATYTWNYLYTWYSGGPVEGAWFLGHLWTLSLEEQFYLFWPVTLLVIGWRWGRVLCWIVPALMPLVRVAWYFAFPDQRGLLGMMFHTAIDSILVGCGFALWRDRIPHWVSERKLVLVIASLFVFIISPLISEFVRPYRVTIGFGLDAVAAGILILHACRNGWWNRVLSIGPLAQIGIWSYSLYLWQQLFLTHHNTTLSGTFPVSIVATFGCALASFYLVEKPSLRLKTRFQRARFAA